MIGTSRFQRTRSMLEITGRNRKTANQKQLPSLSFSARLYEVEISANVLAFKGIVQRNQRT
jgi:hypothetical protein